MEITIENNSDQTLENIDVLGKDAQQSGLATLSTPIVYGFLFNKFKLVLIDGPQSVVLSAVSLFYPYDHLVRFVPMLGPYQTIEKIKKEGVEICIASGRGARPYEPPFLIKKGAQLGVERILPHSKFKIVFE